MFLPSPEKQKAVLWKEVTVHVHSFDFRRNLKKSTGSWDCSFSNNIQSPMTTLLHSWEEDEVASKLHQVSHQLVSKQASFFVEHKWLLWRVKELNSQLRNYYTWSSPHTWHCWQQQGPMAVAAHCMGSTEWSWSGLIKLLNDTGLITVRVPSTTGTKNEIPTWAPPGS